MKKEMIRIKGARENNLKNIDLEVPRNQFVVFTGSAVQERVRLRLTRSMRRASGGTWRAFPPTRASS